MNDTGKSNSVRRNGVRAALIVGTGLAMCAAAQTPPAGGPPSPASQAIAVRKATYTLVANNFKPVGDVLQGRTAYDQAELQKHTARVAYLAELLTDAFPDISSVGDTRAKPEIWTNRADFDKRLRDFQAHTVTLAQVAAKETTASDAFKAAAGAVGQDCKGCHDNFKSK